VLWFEVQVMYRPGQMFGRFQLALYKRFVDDYLGPDISELAFLPSLYLLSHRFEIPLHAIDSHGNAIDQRERLGVFCEHRREHAWDNIAKFSDAKANFFQAGFSITDSGIRRSEGVDCALIQRSARSSMADEVTNSQSD